MSNKYRFQEPFLFKNGISVDNRIVIPPMTEGSSLSDGTVSTDELNYFNLRGGQTGIFISPVANISESGKGFEGELSVADDNFIPRLKMMANYMKKDRTKAILQIFHAGRSTNSNILRGRIPLSPSAIPSETNPYETLKELSNDDIEAIIIEFGEATRRAILAGFDGIELHGANGYLLQQFFSPHANKRTDKWGGNLNKRMNFLLAVIDKAHEVIEKYSNKPFLLGYRISPEEVSTPGVSINDTLKLVDIIADKPLDYLHISQRYVWRTSADRNNGTEPLIWKIKEQLHDRLPLIAVGSIATPEQAEEVIEKGIDFVALGREFLIDPHWLTKIENNSEDTINYTISPDHLDEIAINPAMWKYITTKPHDDPRSLISDVKSFRSQI